jgi:hypothetical protein
LHWPKGVITPVHKLDAVRINASLAELKKTLYAGKTANDLSPVDNIQTITSTLNALAKLLDESIAEVLEQAVNELIKFNNMALGDTDESA